MRMLNTLFALAIVLTTGTMILNAAEIPNRDTAVISNSFDGVVDLQNETSGGDPEYHHGKWCIDGRTF